jgi:hypothetical protein
MNATKPDSEPHRITTDGQKTVPIPTKSRRCRQHHYDRTLDQQRQRKCDRSYGGKLMLWGGHAPNDCGYER